MKFTKEATAVRYRPDKYGIYDYRSVDVRRPTLLGYTLLALASIPVMGAVVSDKYMDIFGDKNTAQDIPTAVINDSVLRKSDEAYQRTYDAASPSGKFALQYLTSSDYETTERVHETNNGSSILGFFTGGYHENSNFIVTTNNGCLNKTSYDIDGGDISGTITGLFVNGSVQGEIPTAAASAFVDSSNPDELIVASGNTKSRDLRFTGLTEGNSLTPADQQTKDVLNTYGCKLGVQNGPAVTDGYSDETSPWIKK